MDLEETDNTIYRRYIFKLTMAKKWLDKKVACIACRGKNLRHVGKKRDRVCVDCLVRKV